MPRRTDRYWRDTYRRQTERTFVYESSEDRTEWEARVIAEFNDRLRDELFQIVRGHDPGDEDRR